MIETNHGTLAEHVRPTERHILDTGKDDGMLFFQLIREATMNGSQALPTDHATWRLVFSGSNGSETFLEMPAGAMLQRYRKSIFSVSHGESVAYVRVARKGRVELVGGGNFYADLQPLVGRQTPARMARLAAHR